MGANCCVAARDKPLLSRPSCEGASYRNVRHSPSWSFRCNRTHIDDFMDNPSRFSYHSSGNIGSESKSAADTEVVGLSNGGSPTGSPKTPKWQKGGVDGSSKSVAADQSTRGNIFSEEKDGIRSSAMANASDAKPSLSIPTTPSSSSFREATLSSSQSCSFQWGPSSSRKARRSCCPTYQLSRQVSCSNCSLEGRDSFVLSVGSNGGSSDGWSMRTFTELMEASASSQRDRWSFDSEVIRSSPQSSDLQNCKICLKLLKEKSPFSARKIISTNELSVVAVLVCGHIYHSECLESMTSEVDRYDPPCPFCIYGEKVTIKLLGKAQMKTKNKISKRAIADIGADFEWGGKSPSMGASSGMKGSFGKAFLRRHFSIGSRAPPVRSVSENETTRKKKWFWPKYQRE